MYFAGIHRSLKSKKDSVRQRVQWTDTNGIRYRMRESYEMSHWPLIESILETSTYPKEVILAVLAPELLLTLDICDQLTLLVIADWLEESCRTTQAETIRVGVEQMGGEA